MKNRALIALVTVVAAVFGVLSLTSLKQELIPSIEFPRLAVLTTYPGASPEVVNDDLSTPIEAAIRGVEGIEATSATSNTNLSIISATFAYGTNLATAEQKMTQAINRISGQLPEDVEPQVISGSIGDLPVIQIAASAPDTKALAQAIETSALTTLRDLPGVRDAQLVGAIGQRVSITPDPAELARAGLSVQSIRDVVSNSGLLIGAGSITEGDSTLSVQSGSRLTSVEEIASLPLAATGGRIVAVGDVSSVEFTDDPITSLSRVNGEPALTIAVTKLPAANTVEVSHAVTDALEDIREGLPGATLTVVFDQAPYIEQSIEALATEGLLGLVFAVVIILIFLLSVRSTIVTAISIPTSVLITFVGLQTAGYSLNILTLGALTIAIGRVVDDSIVVIENIKRHLTAAQAVGAVSPEERGSIIVRAVREVASAITASTITTVAVFLPISFVEGTTGELFRPFALTVTIALLASLVVSLTIVPVLAYWFLAGAQRRKHAHSPVTETTTHETVDTTPTSRRSQRRHAPDEAEDELGKLQLSYLPVIRFTLRRPAVTMLVAVLVLIGTFALTPLMKTNFLGSSGQNTMTVTQAVPISASLESQDTAARSVEDALRGIDGIETVQVSVGSSGSSLRDAFFGGGSGSVTFSITTDPDVNQDELQVTVREKLDELPDADTITVSASAGFGASSDIEVDITANSQADLRAAADAIVASVSSLPGVTQTSSNLSETRPYLAVEVDRTKAAEAGLSETAVGAFVSQSLQPSPIGSVAIDDVNYTIYVQSANPPQTRDQLAELVIPTARGPVRLDSLAEVAVKDGPATITSTQGLRSATVSVTPATDNIGSASAEVQRAVDSTELPPGASASLGGVTADQTEAFSQLGIALLVAILIVYVVMVATFRSLLQPLLLLISVPFAATGAILLQVATGIPLGVPSIIGVLMLIGIVVTNAIVLIDLVNQYRERGMSVREAVIQGAARRLRPILMTAFATIFALLPMALGLTGHGGFISQPLAIVVIGGLLSSTILTLIVLPALYDLVEGARERRRLRKS